ncbi:undecaprenyldiphospho-muramoylpentapeptide beta-N-acetylglucosaminyltransferase [Curvivirga aplysinae]|uniref:undecaprenyldiphospho-muramoylpentapeptide beta-N-acetylglucosaminyltransferase n=1 Tax=Curvivirga aplysinae TaxID=2529852 RepID=UPI0012BBAAE0|nr:undecaprenyldiphospho-muramoylpentapeptide beta-N-acetylglucosaminyltransferase [Curvivirga aplysinae]
MIQAPQKLVVLATGGTGGHVFPAQALSERLQANGYKLVLITDRRGDAYSGTLGNLETHTVSASAVSGRGKLGKVKAVIKLIKGYFQARRILKQLRPDAVVGFGGYPSIPTMIAATRLGFKTVIHEQNAVLGRANRLLASSVDKIAASFEATAMMKDADIPKASWTGNPVRPEMAALSEKPYQAINDEKINILIVGGSQGAAIFGDVIPAAIAALPEELRHKINIIQQVREEQLNDVHNKYASIDMSPTLKSFISDMPNQLEKAHLVICRAGASTISELAAAGRPSILVPYMHAIDDHQTANGARICDAGGAWMIPQQDFNANMLADRLQSLIANPVMLTHAAKAAKKVGQPEADSRLADVVMNLVEGKSDSEQLKNGGEQRPAKKVKELQE